MNEFVRCDLGYDTEYALYVLRTHRNRIPIVSKDIPMVLQNHRDCIAEPSRSHHEYIAIASRKHRRRNFETIASDLGASCETSREYRGDIAESYQKALRMHRERNAGE